MIFAKVTNNYIVNIVAKYKPCDLKIFEFKKNFVDFVLKTFVVLIHSRTKTRNSSFSVLNFKSPVFLKSSKRGVGKVSSNCLVL